MRRVFRSLILLTLALGLVLPGCGNGGEDGTFFGLTPGPFAFGLPLPVLGGGISELSLSNKSGEDAICFVAAFKGTGVPFAAGLTKLTLAPQTTTRFALPGLLGEPVLGGGFLYVDSRAVDAPDGDGLPTVVPTSGYVYPTIERRVGGAIPVADNYEGFAWRSTPVHSTVNAETTEVHLYNASVDFMAGGAIPKGIAFDLKEYDVDGSLVLDTMIFVAPNATHTHVPSVAHGMVSATPLGTADLIRVGMRGCERDFYTSIEQRFKRDLDTQMPALREIGFEVDHGDDFAGNTHDFGLLLSNPSDDAKTVILSGIYRGNGGAPMLTTPRFFTVDPHTTTFMATSTAQSFGLEVGEDSFFDDLFGNVFSSTTFESVTLAMQIPREVDASVRRFDPAFNSFYLIQQGILRTATAAALNLYIEPFLGTGNFDEVVLTNITTNPINVPIRMTTPGGTEYILDAVTVPPLSRFLWSPDGLQLREDPTDTVGPFVLFGCFRFSPPSGLFFRARRREVNNLDTILLITPQIVRDLQNDDVF